MRIKGDHVNGLRHRISGILLVVMLFMTLANADALCSDAIVDDANETQQLPAFDDSEIDAELPGHRNRSKTLEFAISSTNQVVKRILDKSTAVVAESIATVLPRSHPAAFITSIADAPFRPPRLFTQA
jgi:hypothetical protein